jgi:hypothetical protein
MKVGSKAQVFHGTAERTAGGLKKDDLMQTSAGRIVSKKAHAAGLVAIQRLRNAGFVAKKGEFKLFKKEDAKSKSKSKSPANHMKAHNRAVRAWVTRKSKLVRPSAVLRNVMGMSKSKKAVKAVKAAKLVRPSAVLRNVAGVSKTKKAKAVKAVKAVRPSAVIRNVFGMSKKAKKVAKKSFF